MNELRDYQREMLDRLQRAWLRQSSVMVQMPTGTGKTHLMAEVIRGLTPRSAEGRLQGKNPSTKDEGNLKPEGNNHQGGGVLVVAHRRELIEQIRQTLEAFGIRNPEVVVTSIQKLSRRGLPLTPPKGEGDFEPDLVIIDEAHHALAKTYKKLWEWWPKAKFLGLTATPCRLNGAPFTDLFDTLLQSWTIQTFIDKGWLSDFEYVSASPESVALRRVASLKKRGVDGDYQTKELATVMDCPESIAHLYKTYRQFADGKKGIVYAIDRAHAQHIAEYYRGLGVRCAVIDSKTPGEERRRLVELYKASPQEGTGSLDVLINVDIFSEGFDCPEVEFIQLARPTLSLSKYLQQVGRGMRVSAGKPHVLILDNVGLYQTFGLPTDERDWRQTFYGKAAGKGETCFDRYVVLDRDAQDKELVNLEMVRIKSGGRKRAGLEIFLKNGLYGVMNGGKVTCQPRFRKIVTLNDGSGFFAAGIYNGLYNQERVEYSSLIDRKGVDLKLRLFRDVQWLDGYFYSCYSLGRGYYFNYWDPKGKCYYDDDPEFQKVAGVEIAFTREHTDRQQACMKLRYTTGKVSPRFYESEVFYNRYVIVARDYLVVKKDHNHAYQIKGFLPDSILVQSEEQYGYQQFFTDGRKGQYFRSLPADAKRSIFQVWQLGLKRL